MLTFESLFTSIDELYARIPGAEKELRDALPLIREEYREFTKELHEPVDRERVAKEWLDLVYTATVGALAAGLTPDELERYAAAKIEDNNRKTPETHAWDTVKRKIVDRSKLSETAV